MVAHWQEYFVLELIFLFCSFQLDVTEVTTILALAFAVTILFDIPMKEVKSILLEKGSSSEEEDGKKPQDEKFFN